MDETLNKVASIFSSIHLLFGLSLNILLYYLIFKKTTPVFKTMRYFLLPTNTSTMILSFLTSFLQVRTIFNKKSLAIMGQGYCKHFGAKACFHTYGGFFVMGCVVGLLNLHTIFYRMICVKNRERRQVIRKTMLFCFHYLVPVIAISFFESAEFDIPSVYNETLTVHPGYHLEPFGEFGGYADARSIFPTLLTDTLCAICVYAPIFGYYCRWHALKKLDSSRTSLSDKSLLQVRTFINGLTLQVVLPLVCYVPIATTWMYNKYSGGDSIVVSEYFLGTLLVLPSVCDPLLTIYFIVPYRNAVKSFVQPKTTGSTSEEAENSSKPPTEMFQKVSAVSRTT